MKKTFYIGIVTYLVLFLIVSINVKAVFIETSYNPINASHLEDVDVDTPSRFDFTITDITDDLSDDNDGTTYGIVNKVGGANDKAIELIFNLTFIEGNNYTLSLKFTSSSGADMEIRGYKNLSHLDDTGNFSLVLDPPGVAGVYNISVNDILREEQINHSLNYSMFRVWDNATAGSSISEAWLIANIQVPLITDCYYSNEPIISFGRKIPIVCSLSDCSGCIISTYFNGTLLSTSPEYHRIQGLGLINNFNTNKGLLRGYYDQFLMQDGLEYNIIISCGEEEFLFNVTPQEKALTEVGPTLIWSRDNAGILIGFILFFAFVAAILIGTLKSLGLI